MMRKIFLLVILLCWGIVGFTQDGVNFEHLSFKEALDKARTENKLVFVDCYTSWCGPCRDSHPHLKKVEAKYRDKGLVVINIATENGSKAREMWLQAIEEDGMTWTQILNNEGKDKCDVVKDYAITAFPTKVLIDGDGKIVVRAVGESEPIDAKLQEVFGE